MENYSSEKYDSPISHNESRSWFWRARSSSTPNNEVAISGQENQPQQQPKSNNKKPEKPMGRRLFLKILVLLAGTSYSFSKIYKKDTPDYSLLNDTLASPLSIKDLPIDLTIKETDIESALSHAAKVEVHDFSQNLDYVINQQGEKSNYLTFDLGTHTGFDVDWSLLDFLKERDIPAEVFVSLEVTTEHADILSTLNAYKNISIGNGCGYVPRPLATAGQEFAGSVAATSAEEVVREDIAPNFNKIVEITGFGPHFLRPAFPVFDEQAVDLVYSLFSVPFGYSVDVLYTSPSETIEALATVGPRDIVRASLTREAEYSAALRLALTQASEKGISWRNLAETA